MATRPPAREAPAQIGRFSVLRLIGAGGMGVVYAAWDPELDRKVAVKLLHPNLRGEREDIARARLLREAQAMARLSHPNVVSVYDVGTHDEQVFIAMEFVQGVALSAWLRAEPRTWRDIVAVFQGAGRGLAAAHQHGIVHGDFKPDNVLVDRDGRVCVVDFGLAFAQDRDPDTSPPASESLRIGASISLDTRLTRTGALTGTPAYCSPEQFRGAPGSAKADQFAFCVSLHEALYGVRPFPGDDINQLARSICLTDPIPEPHGARVPAWLRRIVLRGLDRDPERRYPDIPALLAELGRDPSRRRRRRAAIAVALIALAAAAWTYRWFVLRALAERQGLCAAAGQHLVGVWDPARREAVQKAMLATGLTYAGDAWTRVAARLDEHAAAWTAMHTDACQATHLRGAQSQAILDLRMACLHRNLVEVRSLVAVLADADADVVEHAQQAVAKLPALAACADIAALQGDRPPVTTPEVAEFQQTIADARVHLRVARFADGITIVNDALVRARKLADPEHIAAAQLIHAIILDETGEPARAATELTEAFFTAEGTLDDRLLLEISIHLTHNATRRPDLPAAHQWARHADALLLRLRPAQPIDADQLEVDLLNARGTLAFEDGNLEAAVKSFDAALALATRAQADVFDRAGVHNNLGNVLVRRGDLAGAEQHLQEALDLYRGELGAQHPHLAIAHNNLAEVHMRRGAWAEAETLYRQAHALLLVTVGASHPNIGVVHNNLGDVLQRRDRRFEARDHYERARAIFQAAFGPDHPSLAYPLTGLGELLVGEGRPADALPLLERSLAMREVGDRTALARTQFAAARARAADDATAPQAALLAERAREAYTAAGPAYTRELREVTAWQQTHPTPAPDLAPTAPPAP